MIYNNIEYESYDVQTNKILTKDKIINNDISELINIGYPLTVSLTLTEILEFCSTNVFLELLQLTNLVEEVENLEFESAFYFNLLGDNKWTFKEAIVRKLALLYKNKNNDEQEYNCVLYGLTKDNIELLPTKIRDKLEGVELVNEIPDLNLPELEVKKVSTIETRRFEEEGSTIYMGNEIKFKDNYLFCDLPVKFMDEILNTKGPLYYDAINKKFSFGMVDEEKFKLLLQDIAENGMRVPFIMEVSGYGTLVDYLVGEHRKLAIKYLGLETIPACLIYRYNYSYPFPATTFIRPQKQNPEFVQFLNEKFAPEYIFRTIKNNAEIPHMENDVAYNKMQVFLNKVRDLILNTFPNEIYTIKALPSEVKELYPFNQSNANNENPLYETKVEYEN